MRRTTHRRRRRRVPWMRPTELRDCGAAAFASVAWAAGHEVSVEEARDLVRTDNNGTHLAGLLHGGRTIGLKARAAISDFDGLRAIKGWAIVHLDPGAGHFVALLRWTRRGLWVMDPNRGRTFMRRADYERESSHYVVEYRRSNPFLAVFEATAEKYREEGYLGCLLGLWNKGQAITAMLDLAKHLLH